MNFDNNPNRNLIDYCLRLADDRLILGHRLGELCGTGPFLEEDIALTNKSLDILGQATSIYEYAASLIGEDSTADKLVYYRNEREFKNILLSEQQNYDFAYVVVRQFLFDSFNYFFHKELSASKDETLAAVGSKAYKESLYHLRHSKLWVLRLGDGTEESHKKMLDALEFLWMYAGEMFEQDEIEQSLIELGIAVDCNKFKSDWIDLVNSTLNEATLPTQSIDSFMQTGGRKGRHTENLGHILTEMQYLQRAYPNLQW